MVRSGRGDGPNTGWETYPTDRDPRPVRDERLRPGEGWDETQEPSDR